MRRGTLALIGAGLTLAACKPMQEAETAPVSIENAWARLPAVPGRPGAAYFTLRSNHGSYTLEGIVSPQVGRIELHDSSMAGGMMRMAPLAPPKLERGAELAFAPEGRHAMLFGIDPTVKPGGTIRLQFRLAPDTPVGADVPVVAASDAPPEPHAH
jgi:copper(I)-binding protein